MREGEREGGKKGEGGRQRGREEGKEGREGEREGGEGGWSREYEWTHTVGRRRMWSLLLCVGVKILFCSDSQQNNVSN